MNNDALEDINQSVQNVEQAVQELHQSVDKVEQTIKDKWSSLQSIGVVFIAIWLWYVASDIWHAKWRYALTYGVDSEKVSIEKQPHDCAFIAAPLGTKFCHYDREVTTLQWGRSTAGNPIASFDEGKTWEPFTPDSSATVPKTATVENVYVS
jgi:hypothetical protein